MMRNTKTFWKFAVNVTGMMILFGGILMLLFRYVGVESADARGEMAANIVRESLTSHMIAGSSEYQNEMLKQIESVGGIRSAWVVRSETISRQYGKGIYPQEPRDEIDRAVLREGKSRESVEGTLFSDTLYRLSIPYVASEKGKIDCMGCHDAKPGEVLGVVSIEMEINDLKTAGFLAAFGSVVLLVFFAVYLLRTLRRFIASYKDALDEVARAMEKAEGGDYTYRIEPQESKEGYAAAMWTNALMEKFHSALLEGSNKMNTLVRIDYPKSDPIYTLQSGINLLYDVEQFRAAIEKDQSLDEVYARLIALLRVRWGMNDFTILELNPINKAVRHIHSEKTLLCDAIKSGCRADRTTGIIDSSTCDAACPKMIEPDVHYVCRNYPISDDLDIVVSSVTDDVREIVKMRGVLEQLGNYINASRLQIINKKLKTTVRMDALTGLYNRLYLEELTQLIVAQSKRTAIPYALLMVDMDSFGAINQSYDAQIGDEVIKAMGHNIQETMQLGDILIRYGGDTFAVVLYDYDRDEAIKTAEAIRGSFKKKIRVNTYAILKTVSIGVAFFPEQTPSMIEAIEFAKRALLEAKHRGGNCSVAYDPKTMLM